MLVRVVPNQLSGFGAFGETNEDHCSRVYANCPDLMQKCLSMKCTVPNPFNPNSCIIENPPPWTVVGKAMRGLPANGQCPGTPVVQAPPAQQPAQPPPNQVPQPGTVVTSPGGAGAGGGVIERSFPQESGLLANKPLLYAGAVALGGVVLWQALKRPAGRSAMNGYGKKRRKARAVH